MSELMPKYAISLQQPWAYAVLHLGKNIENRTWATKFRGPIVIHASKKLDKEGESWLLQHGFALPRDYAVGGYVGEMAITDCVSASHLRPEGHYSNDWAFGPWCWLLANPLAYAEIIPAKGRLGIYDREKLW